MRGAVRGRVSTNIETEKRGKQHNNTALTARTNGQQLPELHGAFVLRLGLLRCDQADHGRQIAQLLGSGGVGGGPCGASGGRCHQGARRGSGLGASGTNHVTALLQVLVALVLAELVWRAKKAAGRWEDGKKGEIQSVDNRRGGVVEL